MATIGRLGNERLLGTYYGLYGLLSGVGILTGNFLSGLAFDRSGGTGAVAFPWLLLSLLGAASPITLHWLHTGGRRREPMPAGE